MNKHPYLRAYMAGIVVPTLLLLVGMTAFCVARFAFYVPVPIERIVVFPMALVPNLWGAWNILYVWIGSRRRLPIGFYGALLPFLIAPAAFLIARAVDFPVPWFVRRLFPIAFPVGLIFYYLAWKYLVGFFNETLEIAYRRKPL